MCKKWKKKNTYMRGVFITSFVLILIPLIRQQLIFAGTTTTVIREDGTQVIYTASNDEIYSVFISEDGDLKIVGKHVANSTTMLSYQTVGFTFASQPANGCVTQYMSSGYDYYSMRYDYNTDKYVTDVRKDNYIETTYTFPKHTIQSVIQRLGYSESDMAGAGITIYLSNIFRVTKRVGQEFVYDDSVIHFDCESIRAARGWSEGTREKLKHYYDMKITLRQEGHAYEVIAVDEKGKMIMRFESGKSAILNNSYLITFPEKIKVAGKQYSFGERYRIEYKNEPSSSNDLIWPAAAGDKIPIIFRERADAVVKLFYKIPEASPIPSVTPPIREPEDTKSVSQLLKEPKTYGILEAEQKGAERFVAKKSIPATESLYANVMSSEYLLGYRLVRRTGLQEYPVAVSKTYQLKWYEQVEKNNQDSNVHINDNKEIEYQERTKTVKVKRTEILFREYAYWEIENLDYYVLEDAVINNEVLPEGELVIKAEGNHYKPPILEYKHSSNLSDHLSAPKLSIQLPKTELHGGISEPDVSSISLMNEADLYFGEIKVRNDKLVFHGSMVLSDEFVPKSAKNADLTALKKTGVCSENTFLVRDCVIPETMANGKYPTKGTVQYKRIVGINSLSQPKLSYLIQGLEEVMVHTPVLCNPIVTANNKKFVQKNAPDLSRVPLVIEETGLMSRFSVSISNFGQHIEEKGYQTRNYTYSIRDTATSYLAAINGKLRNEAIFPFDIILDVGRDQKKENDELIKAGTWVRLGVHSADFYLPMWVKEGLYDIKFRSIAVNSNDLQERIENSEINANLDFKKYAAHAIIPVEVSGRVFNLNIYSIEGQEWNSVPFDKINYTVGTRDSYGNKLMNPERTFPLVNGDHPIYTNLGMLKAGYVVQFSVDTIGDFENQGSYIEIKPKFYFIDSLRKNRKEVDVYYNEVINGKLENLVKIESALDQVNLKFYSNGNNRLKINTDLLFETATLLNIPYHNFLGMKTALFNFANIRLQSPLRTFMNHNYFESLNPSIKEAAIRNGIIREDIIKRRQRWYGEYYLPSDLFVVEKNMDVAGYAEKYGIRYLEDFWLKDGYLVVNFQINVKKSDGNSVLSYGNSENHSKYGHCNMWLMEAMVKNKREKGGKEFNFIEGDFIVYDLKRSKRDDYHYEMTH